MLEGLDAIEWGRLQNSRSSSSEDIPLAFRALLLVDPTVRRAAATTLSDLLNHQLSAYEATLPAIPFLIELVASPTVHGRDELLDLLSTIAFSHWWNRFEAEHETPLLGDAWQLPSIPTAVAHAQHAEATKAKNEQAYNAVAAGTRVYLQLLDFDLLPESATPEALVAHMGQEAVLQAAPVVIAGLQVCANQSDFTSVLDALINMLFRNPRLSWPADKRLAEVRETALRAIVESSYFPGNYTTLSALWRLGRVLFTDGLLSASVTARALLPEQQQILQALLTDPDWEGQSLNIVSWVERLLCAFFAPQPVDRSLPLTAEQIAILQRIASTGFWEREPAILARMLQAYGLPHTREALVLLRYFLLASLGLAAASIVPGTCHQRGSRPRREK